MPLGLDGWLARIEALHPRGSAGIELGLERVAAVKERLGQHKFCPVILVGGTNGKGSTCAMLERILLAAGYRGYVGIEYEGGKLSESEGILATKRLLERLREA